MGKCCLFRFENSVYVNIVVFFLKKFREGGCSPFSVSIRGEVSAAAYFLELGEDTINTISLLLYELKTTAVMKEQQTV